MASADNPTLFSKLVFKGPHTEASLARIMFRPSSRKVRNPCLCHRHPLTPGVSTPPRSEEHTSELHSLMRHPYAVSCLKQNNTLPNTSIAHYPPPHSITHT